MHHDIANVAGRLSISSASAPAEGQSQVFNPTPGGKFDPSSPAAFDARLWVKEFVQLIDSRPCIRTYSVPRCCLQGAQCLCICVFVETGMPLSGESSGLHVAPESYINFRGLDLTNIRSSFRSDVLYNAELDTHLAHLTVGETLIFASCARSIRHIPQGFTRLQFNTMRRDVMMAIFGLNRTINTRVGDDIIRGVSGGERKRVSIAEASLTGAKFQCWDNSTRGLDSANAINFCNNLRLQADLLDVTSVVTLYQAPQATYDTIPDFLTSMTSAEERKARPGFEDLVPRSPDEFAKRWQSSEQRKSVLLELATYEQRHPSGERMKEYTLSRQAEQATGQLPKSVYTISYTQQIHLTLWRAYRRLLTDPGFTIASLLFNIIMALILASMFYNLNADTSSFYYRGGFIFFSLLFNAFASQLEVLTIYAERPAVEKQNRYAFYHQSAQAIASYLAVLLICPIRLSICSYSTSLSTSWPTLGGSLVQSAMFRTLACLTGTPDQAMIPSAVSSLGLMIYTGFTTPLEYMPGWSRWMAYINPLAYGFEALMANEFHNRDFPCVSIVPSGQGYANLPPVSQTCSVVGSEAGLAFVNGDNYIGKSLITGTHIHGDTENQVQRYPVEDRKMEPSNQPNNIVTGKDIFHWHDLCYDIKIKGGTGRLLDHVDGWVNPGVSTILMGVSGAGKTTLLDVLATRVTTGIVTGDTMVNGNPTTSSFQHKVGYVQQQDLHLSTMTVREALQFSAILRQSTAIPKLEKLKYVEHVIDILGMQEYSDAVIGVPGEGLNVEQRKRLTIGVELAARPQLLIFFDEPTSGLDSQTSWAISELIKKLASNGQAVLCTIHQPSAVLFDRFDRLLLIAHGGRTVYFGDLGKGASTLINYFEKHNAPKCPAGGNPAEWMSEVIQSPPGGPEGKDWHQIWLDSPEYQTVQAELRRLRSLSTIEVTTIKDDPQNQEFVSTFWTQFSEVLQRTWKHLWRSPIYIWPKTILIILTDYKTNRGLFFMLLVLFININEQLMPMFLPQRALYEARERPSKTYRWTRRQCAKEENSVGVPPGDLPKFWSFMHRVSPATYLVGGLISSAVANSDVKCAAREILHMAPVGNLICKEFLTPYIEAAGGAVLNPASRDICEYCPLASTNEFLNRFQISYDTRWRDFGLLWVRFWAAKKTRWTPETREATRVSCYGKQQLDHNNNNRQDSFQRADVIHKIGKIRPRIKRDLQSDRIFVHVSMDLG
ncbi:ABC drug exporter AbcA [Trichophyton equinum CBS 127.97]|uniref:ABC drug exporter AbcA n=1 Tax=Trichophyton equinum (strain ATCC MYA-4606 / CBS 127.97) TaxID=559882 RepID=F2PKP4_TRIEC|nr:ABC drug exporter AbcA [Trichophyton equinum CBS 127.97]